jgi:hypothetical protein
MDFIVIATSRDLPLGAPAVFRDMVYALLRRDPPGELFGASGSQTQA